MSLGTHTDTRIDNTHGVLKVCRLVPTAKSSNYKIIIKEHMINCLKQCVVNQEMISNTPTTGTVVVQCMVDCSMHLLGEIVILLGVYKLCILAVGDYLTDVSTILVFVCKNRVVWPNFSI